MNHLLYHTLNVKILYILRLIATTTTISGLGNGHQIGMFTHGNIIITIFAYEKWRSIPVVPFPIYMCNGNTVLTTVQSRLFL
jgi:hypothetical protein